MKADRFAIAIVDLRAAAGAAVCLLFVEKLGFLKKHGVSVRPSRTYWIGRDSSILDQRDLCRVGESRPQQGKTSTASCRPRVPLASVFDSTRLSSGGRRYGQSG